MGENANNFNYGRELELLKTARNKIKYFSFMTIGDDLTPMLKSGTHYWVQYNIIVPEAVSAKIKIYCYWKTNETTPRTMKIYLSGGATDYSTVIWNAVDIVVPAKSANQLIELLTDKYAFVAGCYRFDFYRNSVAGSDLLVLGVDFE